MLEVVILNANLMKENVTQIKSEIMINVDVSVKNMIYLKKYYIWNPATCSCGNGNVLQVLSTIQF